MASEARASDSGAARPVEDDVQDPRLDFFSERFDPLLALTTEGLRPPEAGAKVHDNIHKYWATYHPRSSPGPSTSKRQPQETFERKFLPSQMPIKAEQRSTRRRNVFTRMDEVLAGPLMFLKRCKDERHRVKIFTRHSHGVRGFCEAYLIAFDKFWNMVLQDVTETWTRLRKTKVPPAENLGKPLKIQASMYFPKIEILKLEKKTETCRRHVDELLIRGEQVVLVTILEGRT